MTLQEFENRFSTPEQCLDYLVDMRWSNGGRCLNENCHKYLDRKKKHYELNAQNKYRFRCGNCRKQTSILTETIFEGTPYKLMPLWFRAVWLVASKRSGTSASELQKFLGLGTYRTAYEWLKKIRQAMINPEQDKLQGRIIMDLFSIETVDTDFVKNDYVDEDVVYKVKLSVLIAIEITKKNTVGRIRMSNVDGCDDSGAIAKFIKRSINHKESTIFRDEHNDNDMDFSGLPKASYTLSNWTNSNTKCREVTNKVISYLKEKGLLSKLSSQYKSHINKYFNECCFKFDNRKGQDAWFDKILQSAVSLSSTQYKEIFEDKLKKNGQAIF